ncbi:MAG: carbon-nitrogen hydrolase family protein [Deltaproteobacteria bacterium]|nr:carbon-nitrogen hydrolase family protein [Deltaproteobacteria bacterium]
MTAPFVAAVLQMTTKADRDANRATAEGLVRRAAALGAQVVCLPEMWPFIGNNVDRLERAQTLEGPIVQWGRALAAELGITLFAGTFAERSEVPGKVHNTGIAFGPQGDLLASYRKIHLFDIDVPGGAQFTESDDIAGGAQAVVVDTVHGRFGMTTCYDLRFPPLYQALRDAGADYVLVPSAFTAHTGKDHWEVLLRARAIEQQVYVLAADQTGWHNSKRQSHGHSMIVDPWGLVVARASDGEAIALASIDPARVRTVRSQLPCGDHRRTFAKPAVA